MPHETDCTCPPCRSSRGDRPVTIRIRGYGLDAGTEEMLSEMHTASGQSSSALVRLAIGFMHAAWIEGGRE